MQQFGFRKHSSCESALVAAVDGWSDAIDRGKFVGSLLIDLSKAFDSVQHQLLINRLSDCGCSLSVIDWFVSYLSNRIQRVVDKSSVSAWKPVTKGVPPGSCLSPLLFNLYVNDLPAACSSDCLQYADDVTNSVEADDPLCLTEKLTETFHQVKSYCAKRELTINASKTQFIVFKSTSKRLPDNYQLVLDDITLKPEPSVKLLGSILDQHLTMGPCVDSIVKKCHSLLGVLRKASPFLCRELLKMAYVSLIRPHLEFSSAIFASSATTHLNKLDVIQKVASRIICGAPSQAHSAPLQLALGLESLESRRVDHVVKFVDNILSGNCHPVFQDFFTLSTNGEVVSGIVSRSRLGSKRFKVYGPKVYNDSKNCCVAPP